MCKLTFRSLAIAALLAAVLPGSALGQAPASPPAASAGAATFCGGAVAPPAALPPTNIGPVVWIMGPCFQAQGNVSTVEAQTYLYYMQLRPSQPSQGIWIPYDDKAQQTMRDDFTRLWGTNFLDNI